MSDTDGKLMLNTLGEMSVTRDGTPVDGFKEPWKTPPVLAFILCQGSAGVPRKTLRKYFWPDSADSTMSQAFTNIRDNLGDEVIPLRANPVRIGGNICFDRDMALAALGEGRYSDVIALYQGEFLPGFEPKGPDDLTKWLDKERASLRKCFESALERFVDQSLADGRPNEAKLVAVQSLEKVQDSEPVARSLIRALLACTKYDEARRRAEELKEMLDLDDLPYEDATIEVFKLAATAPKVPREPLTRPNPPVQRTGRPARWQLGGLLAASLLIAAALGARVFASPFVATDVTVILSAADSSVIGELRDLPLNRADWRPSEPLVVSKYRSRNAPYHSAAHAMLAHWQPNGPGLFWNQHVGGANSVDVYAILGNGRPGPLLAGPRDDVGEGWLPDGRSIVVATARWSNPGADKYDGAVLDLATRRLRPLTSGPDFYSSFTPSPDGTRIAYVRRAREKQPTEVCWVPFESTRAPDCRAPAGVVVEDLVGWSGLTSLVLRADVGGQSSLQVLDLHTGSTTQLLPKVADATVSPDGRWIAFRAELNGSYERAWYVAPLDQPSLARRLDQRHTWEVLEVQWRSSSLARYLDSLLVLGPDSTAAGVPMHFRTEGRDQAGSDYPIAVPVEWAVSDSTVARVDSVGTFRGLAPGWVTVTASAGGWRRAARRVRVTDESWRVALSEDWHQPIANSWVPFGDPKPAIDVGPKGVAAFWNRGDGSYPSGAYTLRAVWGGQGMGIRTTISGSVSRVQWQQIQIILMGGMDKASFARWDHTTGQPPSGVATPVERQCGFEYPHGEGAEALGTMSLTVAEEALRTVSPPRLNDGAWHEIWIQIFPDGTCGYAIDRRVIARSQSAILIDRPFSVWILGASVANRMLVGPVEVWQGIRPGVGWEGESRR